LAVLLHGTAVLGVSQTFAALNRGHHLYSAGRPTDTTMNNAFPSTMDGPLSQHKWQNLYRQQ